MTQTTLDNSLKFFFNPWNMLEHLKTVEICHQSWKLSAIVSHAGGHNKAVLTIRLNVLSQHLQKKLYMGDVLQPFNDGHNRTLFRVCIYEVRYPEIAVMKLRG